MSDIKVEGFKVCTRRTYMSDFKTTHAMSQASEILAALAEVFNNYSEQEKKSQIKKVRAPIKSCSGMV